MGGAFCGVLFNNFTLPNLRTKNDYDLMTSPQIQDQKFDKYFKAIFGQNNNLRLRYKKLISNIIQNPNQLFEDPNFIIEGGIHVSKLYSYKNKNMSLYDKDNKTGKDVFEQKKVQFTYLSVVEYFLSQHRQILQNRVFLTREFNNNHIYALRFFCNGYNQYVVVDDKIPTQQSDKIVYAQSKGKQIWPLILQKAWCKQIGGYEKALGLSPVECFAEITGIPAYDYLVSQIQQTSLIEEISNLLKKEFFLSIVARNNLRGIQDGQVFIIDKIVGDMIEVTSPFLDAKIIKQSKNKGTIQLNTSQFVEYFSHLVVGYYRKGYEPFSYHVKQQKRQEKLFKINISKSQQISIRFVQFFKDYLNEQQNKQNGYQYSPMTIFQLYDSNGNLMNFCQGCERLHVGAHSIYFTNNIFHMMQAGTYFLRMEVDWNYPNILNQGNIVFYSSVNNIQIQPVNYFDQIQTTKKLHLNSLNLPNSVEINHEHQPLNIRYLKKKNNILLSLQNTSKQTLKLELDFQGSKNFRIKQQHIQQNKKVVIKLGPNQLKILQILPDDLKPESNIQMCTVRRLPNLQ